MTELVLGIDSSRARRGAREFERSTDRVTRSARGATGQVGRMEGSFSRLKAAAFAVGGALAAIGLIQFTRSITNAALEMERITRAMNSVSASTEEAQAEFGFVRKEAQRLGLDLATSAKQFVQLRAAAKGTSLEGQNVRDIFTSVGEASLALGLTAEQTAGALNALQQIISKGNVSAEELRQQLGERLPGAFRLAAQSIGVTTEELNKMLEQGQLTAEELLPNLARTLTERFGPAAVEAADSAQAAFGRFNTAMFELQATLGRDLLPALSDAAEVAAIALRDINEQAELMDADNKIKSYGEEGAEAIAFMADAVRGAVLVIQTPLVSMGEQIGAVAAAFVAVIEGDFRRALNILQMGAEDVGDRWGNILTQDFRVFRDALAETREEAARMNRTLAGGPDDGLRGGNGGSESVGGINTGIGDRPSFGGATALTGGATNPAGGPMLAAEAYRRLGGEISKANEESEKLNRTTDRLSFTFTSAFEDAIVAGKELSDVLRGLAQDIIRIGLRQAVTQPLGNQLAQGIAGMFGGGGTHPAESANGNLFTSPSVTSIAEAGRPEAVLPLERQGGKLGVRASGGGGSTFNIDARGADKAAIVRLERAIEQLNRSIEPRAVRAVGESRARA